MAYAEWKSGRHEEHCVFEAFFRKSPFKGAYTVFAGLDEVTSFLKKYKFTEEMTTYLK
jgi:nicotinate phosphoribosyltransferase